MRNFLENIKLLRTACPRFKPFHSKIYSYYYVHCNKHILHTVPWTTFQKCFCLCDNLYSLQHIFSRLNLIGLVTEKANFATIRELRAFLGRKTTTLLAWNSFIWDHSKDLTSLILTEVGRETNQWLDLFLLDG